MQFAQGTGQQPRDALRVQQRVRMMQRQARQPGHGEVFAPWVGLVGYHFRHCQAARRPAQPQVLGMQRPVQSGPVHNFEHEAAAAPYSRPRQAIRDRFPARGGQHAAQTVRQQTFR